MSPDWTLLTLWNIGNIFVAVTKIFSKMYSIHDCSSEMNRVNTIMMELQRSNNKADETKLWQAITNLQSAIDRKDDALVDARMQTVEAELEKIAIVSNPSIAND